MRTRTLLSRSKNADFYVSYNSICHPCPSYVGVLYLSHFMSITVAFCHVCTVTVCSVITHILPSGDCRWNKRCCMLPRELQWRKSLVVVMWSMKCSVQPRSAPFEIVLHNYDSHFALMTSVHRVSCLVRNSRRTSVCWATSVMCHPAQVQRRSLWLSRSSRGSKSLRWEVNMPSMIVCDLSVHEI